MSECHDDTILSVWRAEPVHEPVERLARELNRPVYLVGGAVRDALLGHVVEDWDLAVTGARQVAETLRDWTGGRLVALHERMPTYRVVLDRRNPNYCLDICELRDGDIARDLSVRDLTLNALAWNVLTHELVDPLGGLEDVKAGVLRAVSLRNLRADPLRCLRAYRLRAELDFGIEPQTREWLREVGPLAPQVPGERLGEELLKALAPGSAEKTLRLMDEDGVLGALIPEIEPTRGVVQGRYHHRDVWGHTLECVAQLELVLHAPERFFPRTHHQVLRYLAPKRLGSVLLLTALVHDLGKPGTQTRDEHGWRFFGHDEIGAQMARQIARRFRLRRRHADVLTTLTLNHLRPAQLANLQAPQDGRAPQEITRNALLRLFRHAHPHGIGLMLLALADVRACQGPATAPGYHDRLAEVLDEMLQRYLDWQLVRKAGPLLAGKDLIDAGYCPGKEFGEVLAVIEEAHVEDLVSTTDEALALARRLLGPPPGGSPQRP